VTYTVRAFLWRDHQSPVCNSTPERLTHDAVNDPSIVYACIHFFTLPAMERRGSKTKHNLFMYSYAVSAFWQFHKSIRFSSPQRKQTMNMRTTLYARGTNELNILNLTTKRAGLRSVIVTTTVNKTHTPHL
jgi:hypothetical protein